MRVMQRGQAAQGFLIRLSARLRYSRLATLPCGPERIRRRGHLHQSALAIPYRREVEVFVESRRLIV